MLVDKQGNLFLEPGEELRPLEPLIGAKAPVARRVFWFLLGAATIQFVEVVIRLYDFLY